MPRARFRTAALASVASLCVSCGGSGSQSAATPIQEGTGTISAASGGNVSLPGGPRIDVPSGAIPSDTTISIAKTSSDPDTSATPLGGVYSFGPSGMAFLKPVSVTFPLPPGTTEATIFWSRQDGTGFDDIGGVSTGSTISAMVQHFSWGFAAKPCSCAVGNLCVAGTCMPELPGWTSPIGDDKIRAVFIAPKYACYSDADRVSYGGLPWSALQDDLMAHNVRYAIFNVGTLDNDGALHCPDGVSNHYDDLLLAFAKFRANPANRVLAWVNRHNEKTCNIPSDPAKVCDFNVPCVAQSCSKLPLNVDSIPAVARSVGELVGARQGGGLGFDGVEIDIEPIPSSMADGCGKDFILALQAIRTELTRRAAGSVLAVHVPAYQFDGWPSDWFWSAATYKNVLTCGTGGGSRLADRITTNFYDYGSPPPRANAASEYSIVVGNSAAALAKQPWAGAVLIGMSAMGGTPTHDPMIESIESAVIGVLHASNNQALGGASLFQYEEPSTLSAVWWDFETLFTGGTGYKNPRVGRWVGGGDFSCAAEQRRQQPDCWHEREFCVPNRVGKRSELFGHSL